MTSDRHAALHATLLRALYDAYVRALRAALARIDPIGLADPAIDLVEEYDGEAREIARRLVHAHPADRALIEATVAEVLREAYDEPPGYDAVAAIAEAVADAPAIVLPLPVAGPPVRLVPADSGEDGDEDGDGEKEVSGWEALGGLVVIVAFLLFVVGKGAQMLEIETGWAWLPAAAIVGIVVIKVAERLDDLRVGWRERVGSADRVREYLERSRSSAPEQQDEAGESDRDPERPV